MAERNMARTPNAPVNVTGSFGAINFPETGTFIRIVAGLDLVFPGIAIQGTFSVQSTNNQYEESISVVVATGVQVFVGDYGTGLPFADDNLDRIGLLLTGGEGVFYRDGDLKAGFVTGRVRLIGVPELELDATLKLRFNQFGSPVDVQH